MYYPTTYTWEPPKPQVPNPQARNPWALAKEALNIAQRWWTKGVKVLLHGTLGRCVAKEVGSSRIRRTYPNHSCNRKGPKPQGVLTPVHNSNSTSLCQYRSFEPALSWYLEPSGSSKEQQKVCRNLGSSVVCPVWYPSQGPRTSEYTTEMPALAAPLVPGLSLRSVPAHGTGEAVGCWTL